MTEIGGSDNKLCCSADNPKRQGYLHYQHFLYFSDKYVGRDCAPCIDVLEAMELSNVGFLGPHGAGKSTTLREVYYKAKEQGLPVYFIDLKKVNDEQFRGCRLGQEYYVFVDNAQVLRKGGYIYVTALIDNAKLCLAFSPIGMDKGGYTHLKCPVPLVRYFNFEPFTANEVKLYLTKNCSEGAKYDKETTLPLIVVKYMSYPPCHQTDKNYKLIVKDDIEDVIGRATFLLKESGEVDIVTEFFQTLYSVHLTGLECKELGSLTALHHFGIVYPKNDKYNFVYGRKCMLEVLVNKAQTMYSLFSKYDIGGANELLFEQLCHIGAIKVTCFGDNCLTIKGRILKPDTIYITCSKFLIQQTIGQEVIAEEGECSLIKLAHNHFGIDFLIYGSEGTVSSRVLYFIQVSSSRYQDRPSHSKFSAVLQTTVTLANQSPYDYYMNMYKVKNNNAFYIYSSHVIASSKSFSHDKIEQQRVFFHSLK